MWKESLRTRLEVGGQIQTLVGAVIICFWIIGAADVFLLFCLSCKIVFAVAIIFVVLCVFILVFLTPRYYSSSNTRCSSRIYEPRRDFIEH